MGWPRAGALVLCLGLFGCVAVGGAAGTDTGGDVSTLAPDSDLQVEILNTSDPVAGESLSVTFTVENTGPPPSVGNQTVQLDVGSIGSNSTRVELDGGVSTERTLTVDTGAGDAGNYTVTLSSDNDTDSTTATVLAPALFVVGIDLSGTPVEGEPLSVILSITNTGDVEATRPVTLAVGTLGTDTTNVTLAGGDTTSEVLSVDTEAGEAGEYTATVSSDNDTETDNVTIREQASFAVNITGTTDPVAGETLTVTATVENTGDVEGTETVTVDAGALGTSTTEVTLAAGASTAETLAVDTAAGAAGEYALTVSSADDTDSASATVLAPAAFAVETLDADGGVAGERLTVTATVENTGDVEGTETVTADAGALGTNTTEITLSGGASTAETLTVNTTSGEAGEYTLTVTSEADAESANVTVLAVGSFTVDVVDAPDPVAGETLTVTATVANTGNSEQTQTVAVEAGVLGGRVTNVTLGGGVSTEVSLSLGTTPADTGTYTVTVSAEADTDSTNVTVLTPAAFALGVVSAGDPVEGNPLAVTVSVTNTGAVTGEQTVTLSADGLGGTTTDVTLAGGASTERTLTLGTADGDAGAYVAEIATEDDTATANLTVLARPEFLVDIVATGTPVAGEDLPVTVRVENVGDVAGTGTVNLTVGGLGTTSATVTLGANSSINGTLSVDTDADEAGEYTATATTGDDTATANVTVLAPATFAVSITDVTAPLEGEDLLVTASVENVGDVAGTGTVTLNAGTLGTASRNLTLGGGASTTETLTVETAAGDAGEYTVILDSGDDVATADTTVLAPATFTVDVLNVSDPVEGDPVEVFVTVENVGDIGDTQAVTLAVGGLGTDTVNVTLAGGDTTSEVLSVDTVTGEAGAYTAEVASANDTVTANVTVLAEPTFLVDVVGVNTPVAGEHLDVTVAVENAGSAGGTQTLTLDVPGLGRANTTVGLAAGATAEETVSVGTGGGDGGTYTAEVASADDTATANATVLVPASLAVEIVGATDPVVGEALAVTATVENVGDVAGNGTLTLDAGGLGTDSTNLSLAGGATAEETLSVGTGAGDAGTYTVAVSTGDDTASANASVLAPATFTVEFVTVSGPVAGERLKATLSVANTGAVEGTGSVTLDAGALGTNTTEVTLGPGGSAGQTLSVGTTGSDAGNYTVTVTTPDDTVTANVTVLAPAALAVETVGVTAPAEGEDLLVTASVENVGDVAGTGPVTLDAGVLGEDGASVTLAGGASVEETLSVSTGEGDAGNYTVTVTTPDSTVTASATVLAPAALAVGIVETTDPVAGEALAVTATVENVGDVTGTRTLALAVPGLGENATAVTLAGGATTEETLSVATDPGEAGEYAVTVTSAEDTASANASVLASATFDIAAVQTDGPVVEGADLAVTVTVTNTGDVSGTTTLGTDAGVLGTNTTTLTLTSGETVESTLVFSTAVEQTGTFDITVTTGDESSTVTAKLRLPALPGQDGPPADVFGDGLHEDVDGDGAFTIFDVQTFFNHFASPAVQDHVWAYDFTGDGAVSIFDVQAVFNRL